MTSFRSGFAGILGQTNVGKSTFLNAVMGKKLLITSPKPQTTRNRIRCIYTTNSGQIVFVDSPGLHNPKNKLSQLIVREAFRTLRGLDLLLYVVEPWGKVTQYDNKILHELPPDLPVFLLVNKIDRAKANALEETLLAYERTDLFDELIPCSALTHKNINEVTRTIWPYLPERKPFFSTDAQTDRSEEFLVAEIIREHVFRLTYQEIPYCSAVRVKEMEQERDNLLSIIADIIVARESQKGILIGKKGEKIKTIGTKSRADIENMFGVRVFLKLRVKVVKDWSNDKSQIRELTGEYL